MLDNNQEQQLTGAGDTLLHYHLSDRIPTHDTLVQLEVLATRRTVTTDPYTVTEADDILLCPSGGTINFPASKNNGREYEVVMTGTDSVTVQLDGSDLVYGESSVLLEQQGTALRFKSVSGGWIFI